MNIFAWIKNFKIDDQDALWIEAIWKGLEKRNKRDQALVIRVIDLVITRFLLVARHREDVVRNGTREDRAERADAIRDAIDAFQDAHRALRRAFWQYHEALPIVFTGTGEEIKKRKRKGGAASGGE